MQVEKCAHPECGCDATERHDPYCSQRCADQDAEETAQRAEGCDCGHADCG
jgi:endogenous inhibitor of DNA gyrase (YacG/DUF329 family)